MLNMLRFEIPSGLDLDQKSWFCNAFLINAFNRRNYFN